MAEQRRTVFISCGQCTEEERTLGDRVCGLVDNITPFQGYFAKNQVSLNGLSENILKRLYSSVGLIAIMHHRGVVEALPPAPYFVRASVWIEQEIAIAAFMGQVLNRPLYVALFVQHGIILEGIRTQLQLNPIEFGPGEDVITRLREILPAWKEPLYIGSDELRELMDSIDLSIRARNGYHQSFAIEITSHCDEPVEVKGIVLWSGDKKLCEPVYPPANTHWIVSARGYIPIQFNTSENIAWRLVAIHDKTSRVGLIEGPFDPSNHFTADVTVELRCEIRGSRKTVKETSTVNVNILDRVVNAV